MTHPLGVAQKCSPNGEFYPINKEHKMDKEGDGWACRGVRGAITVEENTREAILAATRELLIVMIKLNGIHQEDVGSAIFTTTPDLNAEYPAVAARQLGWHDTALLCAHEMDIPQGLKKCVRVLIMWNTQRTAADIHHPYLKGAKNLRPDRSVEMEDLIAQITIELEEQDT
jgi:chorismate mutase